jgi:hypothetical protein
MPAGRFGLPEEIAHAAVFLGPDQSAFAFGSSLVIGGGFAGVRGSGPLLARSRHHPPPEKHRAFGPPRTPYRAKNAPTNFTQYVDPIGSSASLKS